MGRHVVPTTLLSLTLAGVLIQAPGVSALELIETGDLARDAIDLYRAGNDAEAAIRFHALLKDEAQAEQKDEIRLYLGRALEAMGMGHSASRYLYQSARWPTLYGAEAAGSLVLVEERIGPDLRTEGSLRTINADTQIPRWARASWDFLQGVQAFTEGRWEDALPLLEDVRGPHKSESSFLLGLALERKGEVEAAGRSFRATGGLERATSLDAAQWGMGVDERNQELARLEVAWNDKMKQIDGVGVTVSIDPLPKLPAGPTFTHTWVVPYPRVQAQLGVARTQLSLDHPKVALGMLRSIPPEVMLGREAALWAGRAAYQSSAWTTSLELLEGATGGEPDLTTLKVLALRRQASPEAKEQAALARRIQEQAYQLELILRKLSAEYTAEKVYELFRAQVLTAQGSLPPTLVERLLVDPVTYNLCRRIQSIEMEQLRFLTLSSTWQQSTLGTETKATLALELPMYKAAAGQRMLVLVQQELAEVVAVKEQAAQK